MARSEPASGRRLRTPGRARRDARAEGSAAGDARAAVLVRRSAHAPDVGAARRSSAPSIANDERERRHVRLRPSASARRALASRRSTAWSSICSLPSTLTIARCTPHTVTRSPRIVVCQAHAAHRHDLAGRRRHAARATRRASAPCRPARRSGSRRQPARAACRRRACGCRRRPPGCRATRRARADQAAAAAESHRERHRGSSPPVARAC